MTPSALESWDAVAFTSLVEQRLAAASARLGKARGLSVEKVWLESAVALVAATRAAHGELLEKALRLPELEVVRAERAGQLQEAAVEAVERLQAGITFHAGSRAPLLDSLFAKLKLPALRKADAKTFEKFCVDFEKRLVTQYAKRQFVTPALEFAAPVLEQVASGFAAWRASFAVEPWGETEVAELGTALAAAAAEVKLPLQQARLLAEAALLPLEGAFEESGLGLKVKKRAVKAAPKPEEPAAALPVEPAVVEAPVAAKKAKKPTAVKVALPARKREANRQPPA
jgi:hypothetical protein